MKPSNAVLAYVPCSGGTAGCSVVVGDGFLTGLSCAETGYTVSGRAQATGSAVPATSGTDVGASASGGSSTTISEKVA